MCVFCKYVCGTVCGVEWKRCSFHQLGIHGADLYEGVKASGAAPVKKRNGVKMLFINSVCVFLINCS